MFYYSSKFSVSSNGLKSLKKKKRREAGGEPGDSKGYFPKEGVVVRMAAKTSNTMKTLKCPLDLMSWQWSAGNRSQTGRTNEREDSGNGDNQQSFIFGREERILKSTEDPRKACF